MTEMIKPLFRQSTKYLPLIFYAICVTIWNPSIGTAQVNSGSNGSDGAFNPTTNTVINMGNHPNGIYQYTFVNIPNDVTVTFIPNANNTPVTWLVQSNCEIDGTVNVSGQSATNAEGVAGGPGGWGGGSGGTVNSSGQGPGGGSCENGGGGSFSTGGGAVYGNSFLLPLLGGSGGYGWYCSGGSGGGGAILIAANKSITVNGLINASGGAGFHVDSCSVGGSGSGGGIRLVAVSLSGTGSICASGGSSYWGCNGGSGRVRVDTLQSSFGGTINGTFTQGFQPVIIPLAGQGVRLSIASVAGTPVSATPFGQPFSPDVIISGQQANPIPVVVNCSNLPLNTPVTVTVTPANGSPVSAVGYNTTGTLASSTATVSLVMPRGGGIIYATTATGN